jgi:hypothetical protein
MPSLNSTDGRIERATLVAPESGVTASTRGGSVSGGPPLGSCLRAQLDAASTASAMPTRTASAVPTRSASAMPNAAAAHRAAHGPAGAPGS